MERRDAETQRGSVEAQLPVFRLARQKFSIFFCQRFARQPRHGAVVLGGCCCQLRSFHLPIRLLFLGACHRHNY
jgi:hypothetical protein